ncbi:glycosyltransferase family A protein [Actimicrobium antarcticum]|uniref:glycosyltransferase family A protein n=1 Tax=Actimicrobium antarcticum TaxID=1051899 RepID=UPI0031D5256D
MAKIDVLLPVRNGIEFLAESIDSVKAQTVTDWRLIVLDHGSTDGSRELALDYQKEDRRIEVYSFPDAVGLAGLLNRGLDLADCEYVMRHDADDICFPDRMAVVLAAFALEPECIAIGGQAEIIDAAGNNTGQMNMPVGSARVAAVSFFRNPIAHPTAMLRFSEVKSRGIRYGVDFLNILAPSNTLHVQELAEDYFLFGQLAILGKCTNVPNKLIRYRWHGNNVSSTRFDEQMKVSLSVSRFLAKSFCAMHDLPLFDPAPFCNHGGVLFDVDNEASFDQECRIMICTLKRGLGDSLEFEREMQYRHVISSRNEASLIFRYAKFLLRNRPETGEWNAVRSWLIRRFPGKRRMAVSSQPVC